MGTPFITVNARSILEDITFDVRYRGEETRATKSYFNLKSFLRYSICAFASYEFNNSAACPSPWRSFVNSNPPTPHSLPPPSSGNR